MESRSETVVTQLRESTRVTVTDVTRPPVACPSLRSTVPHDAVGSAPWQITSDAVNPALSQS